MLNTSHELSSRGDHSAFLHRAAHDRRFRASLEADPQAALAEYGLSVDPDQIPAKVTIPSAEKILDVLVNDDDPDSINLPDIPWRGLFGA